MAELKPCPFCGGEAMLKTIPIATQFRKPTKYEYWVECLYCGAGFGETYDKQIAIEAWNRRTDNG